VKVYPGEVRRRTTDSPPWSLAPWSFSSYNVAAPPCCRSSAPLAKEGGAPTTGSGSERKRKREKIEKGTGFGKGKERAGLGGVFTWVWAPPRGSARRPRVLVWMVDRKTSIAA